MRRARARTSLVSSRGRCGLPGVAIAGCILALAAGCVPAEAPPGAEPEGLVEARPFSLSIENPVFIVDGEVSSGGNNGAIPGTPVDQKRDLGRNFVALNPHFTFSAPVSDRAALHFRLRLLWSESTGVSRMAIVFDHRNFPADTVLESELFIFSKGVGSTWRLTRPGPGSAAPEVHLGLGLEMIYGRQVITAPSLDISDIEDYKAIYPYVSAAARWVLKEGLAVGLEAEGGIPLEIMEDRENTHARIGLFFEKDVGSSGAFRFGYVYLRDRILDGAEDPPAVNKLEVGGEGLVIGFRYSF